MARGAGTGGHHDKPACGNLLGDFFGRRPFSRGHASNGHVEYVAPGDGAYARYAFAGADGSARESEGCGVRPLVSGRYDSAPQRRPNHGEGYVRHRGRGSGCRTVQLRDRCGHGAKGGDPDHAGNAGEKSIGGETMNRLAEGSIRMLVAALFFFFAVSRVEAQVQDQTPRTPPPAGATAQQSADKDKDKEKDQDKQNADDENTNPFAPEPAPALPPGMTGSDANDPRAKLEPGLYNAGEAAVGMKHLALVKKPDAFQLGAADPDDPKVQKVIGQLGIGNMTAKIPKEMHLVIAQLAFANSDIAFQGNHLFLGNFYGVNIFDISNPSNTKLLTSMVCPGGQGDVSVYKNLLFMSVEMPNGRLDCGVEGFPPEPELADEADKGDKKLDAEKDKEKDSQSKDDGDKDKQKERKRHIPAAQKDRFRGVRIFDISDITNPRQVAAVQTCRGSHTHTLVIDPNDKDNVYIYVSGTS